MKKKHISRLLIFAGIILIGGAGVFAWQLKREEDTSRQEIDSAKEDFLAQTMDLSDEGKESMEKLDQMDDGGASQEEGEAYMEKAIAFIDIDKLDLTLPIFPDTSQEALRYGSGVIESTDLPGEEKNTTSALAGHRGGTNGDRTFLHIDKLEEGDEIKVTTRDQVLYYEVGDQEVIEPTDWSKFTREEDKSKLILMACHPYPKNDKRLLVKSQLIRVEELNR